MPAPKRSQNTRTASTASTETIEQRLTSFAEQLGTLVGTVQRQAEDMIDREVISKEVDRIRNSATDLLGYVNSMTRSTTPRQRTKRSAKPANAATPGKSRGPVDAPGKRHRQPPPQEHVSRRGSQPKGSQTAPTIVKAVRRGGRG